MAAPLLDLDHDPVAGLSHGLLLSLLGVRVVRVCRDFSARHAAPSKALVEPGSSDDMPSEWGSDGGSAIHEPSHGGEKGCALPVEEVEPDELE
jgi:hypothetical protein